MTEQKYASRAFQLCTDVVTPDWMLDRGQMDHAIRVAIRNGVNPMTAIQMATIQPAEFYRVNHDIGMIAPGRYADILFVEDLAKVQHREGDGERQDLGGRRRSHLAAWRTQNIRTGSTAR